MMDVGKPAHYISLVGIDERVHSLVSGPGARERFLAHAAQRAAARKQQGQDWAQQQDQDQDQDHHHHQQQQQRAAAAAAEHMQHVARMAAALAPGAAQLPDAPGLDLGASALQLPPDIQSSILPERLLPDQEEVAGAALPSLAPIRLPSQSKQASREGMVGHLVDQGLEWQAAEALALACEAAGTGQEVEGPEVLLLHARLQRVWGVLETPAEQRYQMVGARRAKVDRCSCRSLALQGPR
jgi:hypothetical protein